ncbi:MAG: hypothetical protein HOV71_07750 [Hamadaea sp.]|nr:hypothetical protein [Hamadaea sp.]NUR48007.1 hypothetical protein [Hamadaea sp.]NUT01909.1 hypothetical protein [Hamadaea sp.]
MTEPGSEKSRTTKPNEPGAKPGDGKVVRLSLSLDTQLDTRLREAAAESGVTISAWVSQAIEERLDRIKADLEEDAMIQQRLRELDEFFGPVPDDIAREVDEEMIRLGLMDPKDRR